VCHAPLIKLNLAGELQRHTNALADWLSCVQKSPLEQVFGCPYDPNLVTALVTRVGLDSMLARGREELVYWAVEVRTLAVITMVVVIMTSGRFFMPLMLVVSRMFSIASFGRVAIVGVVFVAAKRHGGA